jgi:hypothetical protein
VRVVIHASTGHYYGRIQFFADLLSRKQRELEMRELSDVPTEKLFAMSRTSFERPSIRCLRLRSEMRTRLEQISASENC